MKLNDTKKLREAYKPCVYIWKREGEVLYVGSTGCLKNRLNGHFLINTLYWKDTDELEVIAFRKLSEARDKESKLIAELSPVYNRSSLRPEEVKPEIIDDVFVRVDGDFVRTVE